VPVSRSLISIEALARLLEGAYLFSTVRCQLVQSTMRDTYRVTSDQGRFIFCIYPHQARPPAEIEAEVDFIDHLFGHDLVVGPAILARTGRCLFPMAFPEGQRFGVLFTYLSGQLLREDITAGPAHQYGRAIGQLHAAADTMGRRLSRPNIEWATIVEEPLTAFASATAAISWVARRKDVSYLRQVAAFIRPRLEALPVAEPAYGLLHGDVIPSNALIRSDGAIALLDFDLCGYGWRAYDVATFLSEMRYWRIEEAVGRAFVSGYETIRPLEAWEMSSLPLLQAARNFLALGIPAMKVNEWGSRYFNDRIINRLVANIRQRMSELEPAGPV
jgi:Ser/Thr protein kinase RdoA (MazF antagonist)